MRYAVAFCERLMRKWGKPMAFAMLTLHWVAMTAILALFGVLIRHSQSYEFTDYVVVVIALFFGVGTAILALEYAV